MTPNRTIEAPENHARAITTALTLLDEMLCDFDDTARGRERNGVLYRERNTLSDEQRRALLIEIAAMRATLVELKSTLRLSEKPEDLSRLIWGRALAFWEVLVETQSRHLRRYGNVPAELKDFLDPRIDRLIEGVQRLVEISGAAPRRGKETPDASPKR